MRLARMVMVAALVAGCAGDTPSPRTPTASPDSPWVELATMSVARSEAPAAVLDGRIHFVGGLGEGTASFSAHDTHEIYDPVSDSWTMGAPLPVALHHHMVAASGGMLYVFGGLAGESWTPQDAVFRYDPGADEWTRLHPMPVAIGAGAAVTVGDSIYVIAGVGTDRVVLELDTAAGAWSGRASMTEPREHLAAAELDGLVYVAGGRWNPGGATTTVERYDPDEDRWEEVASLDAARAGHGMAAVGGRLVAFGGELLGDRRTLASVEVYDPATDRWEPGPDLPAGIHGVGATSLDGVVYVVGGAPTAGRADAGGGLLAWTP